MNQKQLAAALGISPQMVSKLAKRGMPCDTVERAERWRRRHLEPARMKGMRIDSTAPPAAVKSPGPAAPHALQRQLVARLGKLAEVDFARYEAELRAAFRAVHPPLRVDIELPQAVFDALIADVYAVVRPGGAPPAAPPVLSASDAELLAHFWAAVAAGEIVRDGEWFAPVTEFARMLLACIAAEIEAEAAQG